MWVNMVYFLIDDPRCPSPLEVANYFNSCLRSLKNDVDTSNLRNNVNTVIRINMATAATQRFMQLYLLVVPLTEFFDELAYCIISSLELMEEE